MKKPDAAVDAGAILERCRAKLADFKIPSEVVFFEALPKTATGKIQKNRITLPPPADS